MAAIGSKPGYDVVSVGTPADRERRFEQVLARLPHGVVVVDRELRIDYVNPAANRFLGRTRELRRGDRVPDPWPDFSLPDFVGSLFAANPPAGGHLIVTEAGTLCVEGLPPAGAPHAILIFDDVTERERSRQAEREFVENAAHELRTPLAAIVSVVEVLESGAKDVPEARDRFLEHLRSHSDRIARLATSLLTLARIQAGREAPRLELAPLRPFLEEVAGDLQRRPNVDVVVRCPAEVATLADRELLYRILFNVAANAAKNTDQGEIVLEARARGAWTQIEIRDTGRGMSRVDREHALDRFHRAPDSEGEGFGLGLAIADEAVRALGGALKLVSTPGVGTCVTIELPSAKIVR